MQILPKLELRNATLEHEVRSFVLEMKANDDGTIEGYGSVFNVIDKYNDTIAPGAFQASLTAHKEAGTLPAMLWQHNSDQPIGVWTEMVEDAKGLRLKGQLAIETVKGKEAQSLLKLGALNGLSIGFITRKADWNQETDIRTLTEVDLWEVSLVTFPANVKARVTNVKSADIAGYTTIRQAERALRDAGFSDEAAKAHIALVKRLALDERDAHEISKLLKSADRLLESINS
ncbi:MAG TPA: HK97 family phage prohead protease [Methylophilaceae bacterium]|nr:HK97 family phage prohead protease [Methylophilaceae bacterium]